MASSSSHNAMPVSSNDFLSVHLWLPDGFDAMVERFIKMESNVIHQGAMERCLNGLRLQTNFAQARSSKEVLSEASLSLIRFSQYEIQFCNGVDPLRLECLCDMLRADTMLFDDEMWTENAGMFLSLPQYCSACDDFGHIEIDCLHYKGKRRTEQSFLPQEHRSGKYHFEKLGLTLNFIRVISVNGRQWEVQTATAVNYNCLIDTVRQSLGLPFSLELLDRVRNALANEFPASSGSSHVRTASHFLGPNFLEFLAHTRAVARLLLQHPGAHGQRHEECKFICIDLERETCTALDGAGTQQREILFVRENGNHFLPVLPSEVAPEELIPWNTDVTSIRAQRRRCKEATWKR